MNQSLQYFSMIHVDLTAAKLGLYVKKMRAKSGQQKWNL